MEKLSALCPDCGVTEAVIDRQAFLCYPESPSYVTYRARLEGTSEVESCRLISVVTGGFVALAMATKLRENNTVKL